MIKCFVGCNNNSTTYDAMSVYKEMKSRELIISPNSFTFTFLLKCFESLDVGRMIHGEVLTMGFDVSSTFVGNTLLNLYSKFGSDGVELACKVFDEMLVRDVSWNTMIGVYMDCGDVGPAIRLFELMPERSIVTWNSVITGLAKNGKMDYARQLFDEMPKRNEVSWNCLISGYLKAGDLGNAEAVFSDMPVKSVVACTAIISGYASIGDVESARKMFDTTGSKRTVVIWNAMISCYINQSMFDEALALFRLMSVDGKCKPDKITLVSVVHACAHLGSLENGKWIAFYINKNKINLSTPLGNALIDMFAKCGDIESTRSGDLDEAIRLTESMDLEPNAVIWGTLISACKLHGNSKLFEYVTKKIGDNVHEFVARDTSHMQRNDIYEILESLNGVPFLAYTRPARFLICIKYQKP
ncbi:hypothetical protein L1987_22030 [Smallanthus sonchifolius]|uniref:Uncharacterized protein n=1 Tax=Smallanthus sonchifolius TaxID=185202 RepID=A0ACB9IDI2_9ASTR|nr:hypothetical protein L1987_22030 [Smallanthus sonchifolius]